MPNLARYLCIVVLFLVLVLIRAYETILFYDPYLVFFENDYLYIDNPRREVAKLILYTSLRYLLNTVTSLGILYLTFREKSIIKFSVLIYTIAYVFLMVAFLYFVLNPKQEDYYLFFNFRRFLIHPILILVLLPAFYYHRLKR
ncbi:exosortase F system-associated protein [Winogradskyella sp.]|nr:exosortase F system-associated protein [Winogradskyella sp.]MDB9782575.1 exosortase F system-associated protein [Winogradskyella sp.]MDC1504480.1 exosortase F system-associated protein [Winogradskyella sp.]